MTALLCGCVSPKVDFKKFYKEHKLDTINDVKVDETKLTFYATDCDYFTFSRFFVENTQYGLVISNKLADKLITIDFVNESPQNVAYMVAKYLGTSCIFSGNTFFIGEVSNEDNASLVRRVDGFSIADLNKLISVFSFTDFRADVSSQGVIFASGRQGNLLQLNQTIDDFIKTKSNVYAVQFFVVTKKFNDKYDLGLNLSWLGSLNVYLQHLNYVDTIQALFSPESSLSCLVGSLVSSPFFLVVDGQEVIFTDGITTPIPNRTVSDAGTVTTNGYTNNDTGLKYIFNFRQDGPNSLIDLSVEDSHITGYVEFAPVVQKTFWHSKFSTDNNMIALVGSYDRQQTNHGLSKLFSFSDDSSIISTRIFCRVFPVTTTDFIVGSTYKDLPL